MFINTKQISLFAIAALLALTPLRAVLADNHQKADPVKANPVKERQKAMRSVGKAMKTSVAMLKGKIAYDAATAQKAMQTMSTVAETYTHYFPKGSDMENALMDYDRESDAKPEIWQNFDDFKMKAGALKLASSKTGKVAAGGKAAFAASFQDVGKSCKGCHSKYKAEKEE